MKIVKYAYDIVFRRKLRTFLTSLGITISVILLSFIIFGMKGLENTLVYEFTSRFKPNDITVMKDGQFSQFLPSDEENKEEVTSNENAPKVEVIDDDVVNKIRNYEYTEKVSPIMLILSLDIYVETNENPYPNGNIIGYDTKGSDSLFVDYIEITKDKDKELEMGEVFIGKTVVDYYKLDTENLSDLKIILKPSRSSIMSNPSKTVVGKEYVLNVVGIVDTGQDRNSLIMSIEQSKAILADLGGFATSDELVKEIGYQQLMVTAKEGKVNDLKKFIEDEIGLTAFASDDFLSFIKIITDAITFALIMFGIVSSVVAGIGIINSMVMSIYEQTKEIGIIKAIGASNIQVLIIFLIQAGTIGLIGGIMGVAVVLAGTKFADPYIVEILQEQGFLLNKFFIVEAQTVGIIVLSSVLLGILAGLYPAYRAGRLDPVKALRYE